jgi:hypothetical protein
MPALDRTITLAGNLFACKKWHYGQYFGIDQDAGASGFDFKFDFWNDVGVDARRRRAPKPISLLT